MISGNLKLTGIAASSAILRTFSKQLANQFLLDGMATIPGIPGKFAQYLLGKEVREIEESSKPPQISLSEWEKLLKERVPDLSPKVKSIHATAANASIGQVHRVILDNGSSLAVKIQYPGIRKIIESQVNLLFRLGEFGKSKRKFGFRLEEYRRFLAGEYIKETNYRLEGSNLQKMRELLCELNGVRIPEYYAEISTEEVLSQEFIDFQPLGNLDLTKSEKDSLVQRLFDFYFSSLFGLGMIHADLSRENWGKSTQGDDLVIIDFGAVFLLEKKQIAVLLSLISIVESGESDNQKVFNHLVELDFEGDKLKEVYHLLDGLVRIMLAPLVQGKFQDMATEIDNLLGEMKWWFRTAGPPWFFVFLKSLALPYLEALRIGAKFDLKLALVEAIKRFPRDWTVQVPDHSVQFDLAEATKPNASHLMISVKENNIETVQLEFPARAAANMSELMPDGVLKELQKQNRDIEKMTESVLKSNFSPQVIFSEEIDGKQIKVWLE